MSSVLSRFHHQFYGPESGRKWVFLHGLMGFLNNWRTIISGLEATERCLAYDQRGHGRSHQPPTGYAPEDYADDLKAIIDELGWEKIVLVGHSMGGRAGLNFCVRFPERVERFVLEDIGPDANPENGEYYRRLLGSVPTPFPDRAAARDFFKNDFKNVARTRDRAEMIGAFFYANMTEREDGTMNWRFSPEAVFQSVEAGLVRDRWDEVHALRVPTLLVRGEESRELKAETFEKMLAANQLIQGVTIPQAGHWVHAEQSQAFLAEIRRFSGLS